MGPNLQEVTTDEILAAAAAAATGTPAYRVTMLYLQPILTI